MKKLVFVLLLAGCTPAQITAGVQDAQLYCSVRGLIQAPTGIMAKDQTKAFVDGVCGALGGTPVALPGGAAVTFTAPPMPAVVTTAG